MKHQTLVEMVIPGNADATVKALPPPEHGYEIRWTLKTGSQVTLLFENLDPLHEMISRLGMLERASEDSHVAA